MHDCSLLGGPLLEKRRQLWGGEVPVCSLTSVRLQSSASGWSWPLASVTSSTPVFSAPQECSQRANNGRFTLRDLLMVPTQRVLKYHLLLQVLGTSGVL